MWVFKLLQVTLHSSIPDPSHVGNHTPFLFSRATRDWRRFTFTWLAVSAWGVQKLGFSLRTATVNNYKLPTTTPTVPPLHSYIIRIIYVSWTDTLIIMFALQYYLFCDGVSNVLCFTVFLCSCILPPWVNLLLLAWLNIPSCNMWNLWNNRSHSKTLQKRTKYYYYYIILLLS